jgi:hypothetical protein
MKRNSNVLTASFICLWVLGWVCVTCLIASTVKDFKSVNTAKEEVVRLANPAVNKLELTTEESGIKDGYRYNTFRLEPFEGLDEDTAYVRNIEIKIKRSINDSFRVTMIKMANGRNKRFADTAAAMIQYNPTQKDSFLVFDKGIAINKHDKFRNQRVIITVYVPVGKQIRVDRNVSWGPHVHFSGPWYDDDYYDDRDDEEKDWHENTDYIMKTDGLYTLDGTPADESRHRKQKADNDEDDNDENSTKTGGTNDTYRYDNRAVEKTDSLQQKTELERKHTEDSIKKSIEDSQKKLQQLKEKKQTASLEKNEPATLGSYQMPLFIHL